jgi:hypothetical protein
MHTPHTKLTRRYCHFYYDHAVFFVIGCNDGRYKDFGCIAKYLRGTWGLTSLRTSMTPSSMTCFFIPV